MQRRYKSLRDDVAKNGNGNQVKRRICLVAWEYEELVVHGGGIGTAFTALARSLAHAGHNVTVLVNRADPVDYAAMLTAGWNEWRALILQRDNVSLHEPMGGIEGLNKARDRCGFACVWSYVAFRWLADRDGQFDIVHFHDNAAFGYFRILARQQMRYFANTLLVVGAHGPHFWERKANRLYLTDTYNFEADYMERYMARWCDYLVAPSSFIVDWMWRNDWRLSPARVRVWQNIMPVSKLVLERRLARSAAVLNGTAFFDGPDPAARRRAGRSTTPSCQLAARRRRVRQCARAGAQRHAAHRVFRPPRDAQGPRRVPRRRALINETLLRTTSSSCFSARSRSSTASSSEVFIASAAPTPISRARSAPSSGAPRPPSSCAAVHAHGGRVAHRELALHGARVSRRAAAVHRVARRRHSGADRRRGPRPRALRSDAAVARRSPAARALARPRAGALRRDALRNRAQSGSSGTRACRCGPPLANDP
jgi:glycosyltransferase involved in cell wall biosynthesis